MWPAHPTADAGCYLSDGSSWNGDVQPPRSAALRPTGIGADRVVDDGLADVDQLPTQPGLVGSVTILTSVDDATIVVSS
jgi:hypothetical protein